MGSTTSPGAFDWQKYVPSDVPANTPTTAVADLSATASDQSGGFDWQHYAGSGAGAGTDSGAGSFPGYAGSYPGAGSYPTGPPSMGSTQGKSTSTPNAADIAGQYGAGAYIPSGSNYGAAD